MRSRVGLYGAGAFRYNQAHSAGAALLAGCYPRLTYPRPTITGSGRVLLA